LTKIENFAGAIKQKKNFSMMYLKIMRYEPVENFFHAVDKNQEALVELLGARGFMTTPLGLTENRHFSFSVIKSIYYALDNLCARQGLEALQPA